MKKIYLKPEIECAVVGAVWSLCDGTVIDSNKTENPEDPFGAPARVF